jgi:starch phosphorylase
LRFVDVKVDNSGGQHRFEVHLDLADLDPNAVRVELYADGVTGGPPARQEMQRMLQPAGAPGVSVYSAAVSSDRPVADYSARVIPNRENVAIPLEDARVLWQR